ncbi:MAG TPA: KH domain-containing protein [Bacillota bacterium]|nr:KH domain-containing protein [Bacillota bacterium]HPT88031.1 KH domain-containing protein [Bacillota bacterium]
MKDLVLQVTKALVDHPEDVIVEEFERNNQTLIEITVNPEDVGKIIGKQGRIIKALRTVVKSCAMRDNKKVAVELTNR